MKLYWKGGSSHSTLPCSHTWKILHDLTNISIRLFATLIHITMTCFLSSNQIRGILEYSDSIFWKLSRTLFLFVISYSSKYIAKAYRQGKGTKSHIGHQNTACLSFHWERQLQLNQIPQIMPLGNFSWNVQQLKCRIFY